jgi:hypothetical protein
MACRGLVGLVICLTGAALVAGGCASSSKPVVAGSPEQDMQIYMQSGMPGEMHKMIAEGAGNWTTTNTMWMAPDAPPMVTKGTAVTKMSMDGRFAVTEVNSPMGEGMSMSGVSTMGFDNVQKKFVGTWIDNMGSGIMQGVGTPSNGGKRIDWVYTYSCPITNSQRTMREVHTRPDKDTLVIESFAKDPRTNKEMQCMRMEAKRAS